MPYNSSSEGSGCVGLGDVAGEVALVDVSRHVKGCHLSRRTRVQDALDRRGGQYLPDRTFRLHLAPAQCGLHQPHHLRLGTHENRPISLYRLPRRALTLCPQLCMGSQPGARFPARSADALPATEYGHFTQAIYRNRPIARRVIACHLTGGTSFHNVTILRWSPPPPGFRV
jgi:hypothetical protein